MKTMFQKETYEEIVSRLDKINHTDQAKWGKMSVDQMLAHCVETVRVAAGDKIIKRSLLGYILGPLVKKDYVSEKPFGMNSPTAPEFKIVDKRDFEKEKQQLIFWIEKFHSGGVDQVTKYPHGFFGHLTPEQWALTQYKHLDHHFRQFER